VVLCDYALYMLLWRRQGPQAFIFLDDITKFIVGRESSVGIATRYGLDGSGIEFRWGRDFPHPYRTAVGLPSSLYNGYRVFLGVKSAGA